MTGFLTFRADQFVFADAPLAALRTGDATITMQDEKSECLAGRLGSAILVNVRRVQGYARVRFDRIQTRVDWSVNPATK